MASDAGSFETAVHLQKLNDALTRKKFDVPLDGTETGVGVRAKVQVKSEAWVSVKME